MSLIQKIRDKYARIAVIAIGLALLGFILMDAFAGRSSMFGSRDTTIGKINGEEVEADPFMRRVSEITKRQGFEGENGTAQAVNGLWQQELTDRIMGDQYEELGMTITDRELDQLLFGPNPPQEFRQALVTRRTPKAGILARFVSSTTKSKKAAHLIKKRSWPNSLNTLKSSKC
jgi:peptidyl-prolyl cis-trans isomerase D